MTGHIVAIGGGGFPMEPENPLLEDFILSLARRSPARVCFVPTASGDSAPYITKFYRAMSGRCIPTDLTFFDLPSLPRHPATTEALASFVEAQDVFYVGGGNTAALLGIWRTHGLDHLLRRAWKRGAVLCGISAGMLCWFQGGLTDSFGGLRYLPDGLGLLKGSATPHYDGEPGRRPAYRKAIAGGAPAGYAAEDGTALHFIGTRFQEAVRWRPNVDAYRVALKRGEVVETPLLARDLGAKKMKA